MKEEELKPTEDDVFKWCTDYIRKTDKLMYANDAPSIDLMVESLDVTTASPEMMICTLRSVWPFKDKLKSWVPKLVEIHAEMEKRSYNIDEMLINLVDYLPETRPTREDE